MTTHLGRTLRETGFQQVGIEVNAFDFSYYNEMENRAWRNMIPTLLNEIKPFLLSQGVTTQEELGNVEFACLTGMYQEDFCGIAPIYTFIGSKDE